MNAVLLPSGPLERTVDVNIDDWLEPGWPEALALTVVHGSPERVVHDGQQYEVRPVGATFWKLSVALPGGLGVYSRAPGPIAGAHPVTLGDPRPAARPPRTAFELSVAAAARRVDEAALARG